MAHYSLLYNLSSSNFDSNNDFSKDLFNLSKNTLAFVPSKIEIDNK